MSRLLMIDVVVIAAPMRVSRGTRERDVEGASMRSLEARAGSRLWAGCDELALILVVQAMTYSIFDSTGNLIDAFADRAAALDCLAKIADIEPECATDVLLLAQDAVVENVDASSMSTPT